MSVVGVASDAAPSRSLAVTTTSVERRLAGAPPIRAAAMPISLESLPSADLLDQVLTGEVSWEDAMEEPSRARVVSVSEVANHPHRVERYEYRRQLLRLRETHTAREAVMAVKGSASGADTRAAQRLFNQAAAGAPLDALLVDGRLRNTGRSTVMVPLVKALVLLWYNGRRGIKTWQIAEQVQHALANRFEPRARAAGYTKPFPVVKEDAVEAFIARLPQALKLVREPRRVLRRLG